MDEENLDTGNAAEYRSLLEGITQELGRQNTAVNQANKAYKGLVSTARQLQLEEEGILDLSEKQLKDLKAKTEASILDLKTAAERIRLAGAQNEEEEAILAAEEAGFEIEKQGLEILEKRLELLGKVNASFGVFGKLTKAIAAIPVIGKPFADAFSKAKEQAAKTAKETGQIPTKLQSAGLVLKNLADIGFAALLAGIAKQFLALNKTLVETRQLTGQTAVQTLKLQYNLQAASIAQGALYETTKDLLTSYNELTKQTGVLADVLGTEAVVGAAVLKNELGLSADQAGNFATYAAISGQRVQETAEGVYDTVNAFNRQNKTALSAQQILAETASTSKEIGARFAFNSKELAKAVTQAKELGLSLSEVDQIANSLLQFESSISAELEAELLTGQQLNLEKARQFALTNDLAGLGKELEAQGITAERYAGMNRIQQEATAKALGMSADQMGKMLYQQQLNTLSAEEFKNRYGEQNYEAAKQLDIQKKLEGALTKIADALTPIVELFAGLVSNAWVLYTTLGLIGAISLARTVGSLVTMGITLAGSAVTAGALSSALTFGLAGAAIAAAILGIGAAIYSATSTAEDSMDDGMIKSDGTVIKRPEGSIKLNDNDSIIAGTNLDGGGAGNGEAVALLRELVSLVKAGGTITIDGQAVGKALTLASYTT